MSDESSSEGDCSEDDGPADEDEEEAGEGVYTSDSSELYMTVYRGRDEDPEESDLETILNEAASDGKVSKRDIENSEIYNRKDDAEESLNYLHELLDEYYDDPEKYDSLRSFLSKKGYKLKDPVIEGVYDDDKDAVARTDTEESIEGHIDLYDKITSFARRYGLSHKEAEDYVITHELVHLAQPYHVKMAQPFPYMVEIDAELTLTEYFAEKALESKGNKRTSYEKLANAAYSRVGILGMLLKKEYGIEKEGTTLSDTETKYSIYYQPLEKICDDCHRMAHR